MPLIPGVHSKINVPSYTYCKPRPASEHKPLIFIIIRSPTFVYPTRAERYKGGKYSISLDKIQSIKINACLSIMRAEINILPVELDIPAFAQHLPHRTSACHAVMLDPVRGINGKADNWRHIPVVNDIYLRRGRAPDCAEYDARNDQSYCFHLPMSEGD